MKGLIKKVFACCVLVMVTNQANAKLVNIEYLYDVQAELETGILTRNEIIGTANVGDKIHAEADDNTIVSRTVFAEANLSSYKTIDGYEILADSTATIFRSSNSRSSQYHETDVAFSYLNFSFELTEDYFYELEIGESIPRGSFGFSTVAASQIVGGGVGSQNGFYSGTLKAGRYVSWIVSSVRNNTDQNVFRERVYNLELVSVPEPPMLLLMGTVFIGLFGTRRYRT